MSRTPVIAGNWKMNHLVADAEAFIGALLPKVAATSGVEIVVCPPYLSLQALVDSARGSQVAIYAQNMHEADSGAYTGEVSAPMLTEIDVAGVILGHSERRAVLQRDRRGAPGQGPQGAGERARADPVRRRDPGGARGRRDGGAGCAIR